MKEIFHSRVGLYVFFSLLLFFTKYISGFESMVTISFGIIIGEIAFIGKDTK